MNGKLAVLGGTFNPIHFGHLALARGIAEKIEASQVLLIPSSVPPHKEGEDLASPVHRLNMCGIVAKEDPLFSVSSLEIRRGGTSYTVDTVAELKKTHPHSLLYFICGADMFQTVRSWYQYNELIRQVVFCAAPRDEIDYKALRAVADQVEHEDGGKAVLCDLPVLDISSTEIRKKLRNSEPVNGLLPRSVVEYIRENRLYGAK